MKTLVTYQSICEGEIKAVEPVILGTPLGLDRNYPEDTEALLAGMAQVLALAGAYGKEPSDEALDALKNACKALHEVEVEIALGDR